MRPIQYFPLIVAITGLLAACGKPSGVGGVSTDASPTTLAANALVAQELKLDAPQDFEDAKRGFID